MINQPNAVPPPDTGNPPSDDLDQVCSEDVMARFAAYGWQVEQVDNGNDVSALSEALQRARADETRPSLICVRTHIGFGSPHKQDTYEAHGGPLGTEEVRLTKQHLGWPEALPFNLPHEVLACFRQALVQGAAQEATWQQLLAAYRATYPALADEYEHVLAGDLPSGWETSIPQFAPDDGPMATRKASGKVLTAVAEHLWNLVGGSADLNPSTNTALAGRGDFQRPLVSHSSAEMKLAPQGAAGGQWGYNGQNVHFGVREHAMGSGIKYVFTHDSIALGEDGPTHQPVEHLAVEAGVPQGWCKYVGEQGEVLGVNRFGASAPDKDVLFHSGFTVENVVTRALALVTTNHELYND